MNKSFVFCLLGCTLLTACHSDKGKADTKTQTTTTSSSAISRESSVLASLTATVEAIDLSSREVTLKGPLGNEVTFVVDKSVQRLNEIKVGDTVTADYYVSVAADVRKPSAEETKHPITLIEGGGKTPGGAAPAIGGLRRYKVVTTVESLDAPAQTVTIKGPMGNSLPVRVDDPSVVSRLKVGETIVITYTEALAVALKKIEKN